MFIQTLQRRIARLIEECTNLAKENAEKSQELEKSGSPIASARCDGKSDAYFKMQMELESLQELISQLPQNEFVRNSSFLYE